MRYNSAHAYRSHNGIKRAAIVGCATIAQLLAPAQMTLVELEAILFIIIND